MLMIQWKLEQKGLIASLTKSLCARVRKGKEAPEVILKHEASSDVTPAALKV